MTAVPRIVVSAPSSGHGKTAVTVGLLAALAARGLRASGFKIGPDHTDAAFFQRPEVRDVIAWLRLLADPTDAAAAVRALSRPPVELRSVDLARHGEVDAHSGRRIEVRARSLCLHGDTPGAVDLARRVRDALEASGVRVEAFV